MERDTGSRPSMPRRPSHCQNCAASGAGVASVISGSTFSRRCKASTTKPSTASTTDEAVASATAVSASP